MYSTTAVYPMAIGGGRSTYDTGYSAAPSMRFRDALNSSLYATPRGRNAVGSGVHGRAMSVAPASRVKFRETTMPTRGRIRDSFDDSASRLRFQRSPSVQLERSVGYYTRAPPAYKTATRDDLIDSIMHTRTNEHRVMPGFRTATTWEERRGVNVDCDKVYPGIYLANGETIQNVDYLKSIGVTHVLNTAERHVPVNPNKYPLANINYFGFHVDDHPSANISRFFTRTSDYIDEALRSGGTVAVNCVMGWSRSATVVGAYLVSKKGMSSTAALEQMRAHRPIRPNPGFLNQLADYENIMNKRLVW